MQNKNFLPAALALCLFVTVANAQTPNWASDVAPILYENCVKCHRDGGIGHFSLIGYGNAYANRFAIMNATETRQMPPWKPDPEYRRFAHERRLTDDQIQAIQDWVLADAPRLLASVWPPADMATHRTDGARARAPQSGP